MIFYPPLNEKRRAHTPSSYNAQSPTLVSTGVEVGVRVNVGVDVGVLVKVGVGMNVDVGEGVGKDVGVGVRLTSPTGKFRVTRLLEGRSSPSKVNTHSKVCSPS